MALHRDIFWIGRQWAVTGFGMQAINQKHNGQFDIPVERLWDDDLPDGVRGQKWFNPDDFAKGLAIAQARHPKPPSRPASPPPSVEKLLEPSTTTAAPEPAPLPVVPTVDAPTIVAAAPEPAKRSIPPPSLSPMRLLGHPAKLVRVWRARRRS
jgi:hypothetical protein